MGLKFKFVELCNKISDVAKKNADKESSIEAHTEQKIEGKKLDRVDHGRRKQGGAGGRGPPIRRR